MLYYLEKFCRICIQTGGKLTDIDSKDHDSVTFSEKLKICTQMVITRESLSTQICSSCVHKLRISYQFQNMCKKSTAILQQYLEELLTASDDINPDKLTISATLPKPRRKRIGKDERCSLLKKLLSRITQEQIVHNIHINGLAKLCDQISPQKNEINLNCISSNSFPKLQRVEERPDVEVLPLAKKEEPKVNSLRNLLNFAKEFDFGYDMRLQDHVNNNFDLTPLERLAKFTESFFYDHFGDYRETILYGEDNANFDSSDEEEMFEKCEEEEEPTNLIKQEILIVEPDLNLKKEMFYDERGEESMDYDFSSNFVQACYGVQREDENSNPIKQEPFEENVIKTESFERNYIAHNKNLAEIIPITHPAFMPPDPSYSTNIMTPEQLYQLQNTSYKRQRTLSPYSVKCRTRGNPFINPQLKKQFLTRNFKCDTCNRRFKSPGYLKAHRSKLRH